MRCADPIERAVWLRLADHWAEVDRDDDVPAATPRRAR